MNLQQLNAKCILVPETGILLFPAITHISSFDLTWWYRVQELRLKESNNIERPSYLFIYERTEFFSKF